MILLAPLTQLAPASKTVPPLGRYTVHQILSSIDGTTLTYAGVVDLKSGGKYAFSYDRKTVKGTGRYTVADKIVRFATGPYSGMVGNYRVREDGVPNLRCRFTVDGKKITLTLNADAYKKKVGG